MTALESAILRTVAYFDLFSYPLTSWEVWKWLLPAVIASPEYVEGRGNPADETKSTIAPAFLATTSSAGRSSFRISGTPRNDNKWNLIDVVQTLESSTIKEKLEQRTGFTFLRGRSAIINDRQERYRLALEKLDRAAHFTRTLARIPFVRAVFACNSLGFANARAESDIDFFIIVQRNHVWAARLLAAGWAKLRKLRPMPGNRADKFCLSFFLADDALDVSLLRLATDPYLTMWVATLVPLYDPGNLHAAFWQANAWAQQALPNAAPRELAQQRRVHKSITARILAPLVRSRAFERMAERLQRRALAPNLRALANQDTRVILNDHMLKFHDNDRREEYAQSFASRLAALGL
ncbi:MAG: hypothetical protein Q8O51_00605 [bacterium]|nr:hypothetical protein [bacterium]